jgi:hypothetical protein
MVEISFTFLLAYGRWTNGIPQDKILAIKSGNPSRTP